MEKELIVKWKIKESETQRILTLLEELVENTRNEPGNVLYNIYQSVENTNEIILHECYVDADAVEAHKGSKHYQKTVLEQIIPHLEIREVNILNKLF
ncbi:antibiotic biosynthesis monooxygenase [Pedobacter antarcticus 4BY]|uniref:Antibiotic biosynthesis monooxygenase n=2 Tax=Pedobacter antarcticus TaxID=34086 RepID=A0A081PKX8_9SPHI|nr:putative quinol monooxygenase [Pedobacter antarcticus]KEQ31351.1 antibiotic biosynthesis monooxygenase [Pedobacter antarcticus 4BY]SFE37805.1 Quinol monooxygenase YgiN [Pedobacter antarcticus]